MARLGLLDQLALFVDNACTAVFVDDNLRVALNLLTSQTVKLNLALDGNITFFLFIRFDVAFSCHKKGGRCNLHQTTLHVHLFL